MDISQLISILENPPDVPYPVILPDFFVDHYVLVPTFEAFVHRLELLAGQGGGNLLDNTQFIRKGGNSVNTASALLSLGLSPKMIITTDEYGASLLKALAPSGLDLSHVHTDGRLSTTVSIETEYQNRKINLMISDSGSASSFKYSDLTPEDFQIIENSGLVALVNLNHNQNGADLAHDLFTYVKDTTNAITFMDIGDPSSHPHLVKPLATRVLKNGLVDILGVNENEIGWVSWVLSGKDEKWKNLVSRPNEWLPAAKMIAHETGVRVDLHTPQFSMSVIDNEVFSVPSFQTESRVVCGAGDAWNAGNIYGELLRLSTSERLILANAVAALYISSETANHPTRNAIVDFLERKMH
ncbi:carbohydrate kinase family protein [Candidatus Thorarchaeota archaeon]|nr:MAG: carbohydrate kinase family protein [Candidatus Thorarchaeota archaeon]